MSGCLPGGGADLGIELREDHVALVEIRRPPNNFIDLDLVRQLGDAFDDLARSNCRAIVLAADGKHFCAGADFQDSGTAEPISPLGAGDLYREARRLFGNPLPVVACVQGAAVGGGAGLALAADFRVAAPSTRFWVNFSRLGIHQGFAISVTLPRIVGPQRAAELLMTGRRCKGEEAHRIGMCDLLVPEDQLRDRGFELAAELATAAPLAVRSIRATLRGNLAEEAARAMEHELAEQLRLRATEDHQEGLRSIAERRPPRFEGR